MEAEKAGADEYIAKPFSPSFLLARMIRLINLNDSKNWKLLA
jgi:DNA-binding response OmpR family regulator